MKHWLIARPYWAACLFEGLLIPVALPFVWLLGLRPWERFDPAPSAWGQMLLAAIPLLLWFAAMIRLHPGWFAPLESQVRALVRKLFAGAPAGAIVLVCLLAGIGEELLFRGVLQDALQRPLGPAAAVIAASLLFGVAHAVSPAYLLVASLLGLYLGLIYQATGNLLLPIGVHALYDWVVIHYYLRSR